VMRLPPAGMVTSAGWSHSSDRILYVRFGKVRISMTQAGAQWKERVLDVLGEIERLGRIAVAV